ncbi:tail fiber assembly protein [Kosakonia pseudosacchari]|uniref:tail fiber assembly protein n=1 Tax=Kosakonia pseudosacchari TaxID=1646340 RepID=UPI003D977FFF
MQYVYSAKDNLFHPLALRTDYEKAGTWPDDGEEVDEAVFYKFTGAPPEGKQRRAGKDGLPVWADIPAPSKAELVSSAADVKAQKIQAANDLMNSKQWPGKAVLGRLKGDELAQYQSWLDYLDELETVDTSDAPDIRWPDEPN